MSAPIDDGGPAFPNNDAHGCAFPGMNLFDYFAGQALTGILAASGDGGGYVDYDDRCVARSAWKMADAMLAARKEVQS
jgi:hypothetical protein